MNKVLIVALAVCLVSVHAFVKRDADKTEDGSAIKDLGKQGQAFIDNASKDLEKIFSSENAEKIKKVMEDTMENLKKMFENTEKKE